jgi:RNA polymerase sigma factor (sigma-70 family)
VGFSESTEGGKVSTKGFEHAASTHDEIPVDVVPEVLRETAQSRGWALRNAMINRAVFSHIATDIDQFSRSVNLRLRTYLRSPDLVEDACQETFLRVLAYFRAGKVLNNPAALSGFVNSVCHNVALEFLRAHTRQCQLSENTEDPVDAALSPEDRLMIEERNEMVARVLGELPEGDRRLLHRIYLNEEDKEVVCIDLQIKPANYRCRLHRARGRFKTIALRTMAAREIRL